MSDDSDSDLLDRVAAGGSSSNAALEVLMLRHRRALLLFLIRRGAGEADAEDIVQDVFLRVRDAAHSFRGAAQVSSWLHGIARNLLVDLQRAMGREQTLDERQWDAMDASLAADGSGETNVDVGEALDRRNFEACIKQHYASFARRCPAMADALHHVVARGWKSADLAAALGRTETATRKYLESCRKALGRCLQPCSGLAQAVLRG